MSIQYEIVTLSIIGIVYSVYKHVICACQNIETKMNELKIELQNAHYNNNKIMKLLDHETKKELMDIIPAKQNNNKEYMSTDNNNTIIDLFCEPVTCYNLIFLMSIAGLAIGTIA